MDTPTARLRAQMRARLLRVLVVVAGCGLAVTLAACGGSDEPGAADDTASSAATSGSPDAGATSGASDCAEIWIDGQQLPQRYSGCTEDGVRVKVEKIRCSSGQVLVTYADRFYAVLGGPVNETDGLADDKDYRQTELSCLA